MPSKKSTSASNAITVRLRLNHTRPLAQVTAAIADSGGNIGAIDIIRVEGKYIIRDITIDTTDEEHAERPTAISDLEGVDVQMYQIEHSCFTSEENQQVSSKNQMNCQWHILQV